MKIEQNVCRLCTKAFENEKFRIIDDTIRTKIQELLRIKISYGDSFNLICINCGNSVDCFHTFFQEIHSAQTYFSQKRLLTPEIKIEETVEFLSQPPKPDVKDIIADVPKVQPDDLYFEIKNDVGSEIQYDSDSVDKEKFYTQSKKQKEERMINMFFDFVCPKCKRQLKTWKKYRKHMQKKHAEKRPKMLCCNSPIEATHLTLLGHLYCHNDPERLKCIACDKQYHNFKSLSQHNRNFHSHPREKKEKPKVFCPECGVLLVKRCLQNHLKTHQPRVKLQCDMCQKFLQSRKAMLYHMTQQHLPKNPNFEQFLCNICAKSFDSKDRFNHHLRYHHDDKTGKCPDCNVVMRLENLRVHRKRVHEIKKVTCPICFKEFKNNDRLRGHKIKVHVEPKFECDICQKKYKTKDKMQEHRSTHFNELRFKCDLCDHMNNDYGNMTKHRKTKHRDVPYPAPGTARKVFEMARH